MAYDPANPNPQSFNPFERWDKTRHDNAATPSESDGDIAGYGRDAGGFAGRVLDQIE